MLKERITFWIRTTLEQKQKLKQLWAIYFDYLPINLCFLFLLFTNLPKPQNLQVAFTILKRAA